MASQFHKLKKAFSLIELSIVILIIGILIAGVTQSSRLIRQFRIQSAQTLTQSAPVTSIKDLTLWLETTGDNSLSDANNSFALNDGDAVQNWYDINPQSISKKNFAATASAKRPTYKSDGINSLPSLTFARSTASLYFENTEGVIGIRDTTYTLISVLRITSALSSGNYYFVFGQAPNAPGAPAGNLAGIVMEGSTNTIGLATGGNDYYPSSVSVNSPIIFLTTVNGNNVSIYRNSKTASSSTLASTNFGPSQSYTRVGVAPYNENEGINGNISEVIVFDRVLKTEEINSIIDYLAKKYAVKLI